MKAEVVAEPKKKKKTRRWSWIWIKVTHRNWSWSRSCEPKRNNLSFPTLPLRVFDVGTSGFSWSLVSASISVLGAVKASASRMKNCKNVSRKLRLHDPEKFCTICSLAKLTKTGSACSEIE